MSALECTNAQVADMQIVVEKGRQDLSKNKEREVDLKVRVTKLQYEVNKVLITPFLRI